MKPSLVLVLLAAGCAAPSQETEGSLLVDPEDGAFDLSQMLATRTGFLPVPLVITEPAVGFGGGLGMLFIHDRPLEASSGETKGPPSITAAVGAYTESDTWFAGLGHFGSWAEDHWRYVGFVGDAHANLEFNGSGGDDAGTAGQSELDYGLDGFFLRQQLLRRIAEGPMFLGLRYDFGSTDTEFESGVPTIAPASFERQDASLAAVAQFDSRDSIFTPSRGVNASFVYAHYDEAFGGDTHYDRYELQAPIWVPIGQSLVFGVRPALEFVDGNVPFYALPYVELRGVPVLRYQGRDAASIEAELRWNFVRRWALVGFGGAGQAVNDASDFGAGAYTVGAGGVGFRYMLASKYGLHAGLDVATGPEGEAVYIQVGSAWH